MISVEESGLNISGRNMTDADPEKILESSVEKSLPPSPKESKGDLFIPKTFHGLCNC